MAKRDEVRTDVSREVEGAGVVQRLAKRVGLTARASAVFGDPVVNDKVTVIPVAKATWGFGGGSGGEAENQGSGGGGGGIVTPIGFIEIRREDARFVPIRDVRVTALRLAATLGVLGWLARRR
jgi:uncharacterized spore protein YtfJ